MDELRVAEEGFGFELWDGSDQPYRSYFMLRTDIPSGGTLSIAVASDDDLAGLYDGDEVSVSGFLVGQIGGTNAFGADVDIPLMEADSVTLKQDFATPEASPSV